MAVPSTVSPILGAAPTTLDMGLAPASDSKEIVITLGLLNRPALEAFVASTVDPTSANFRKFLTPAQFAASYGQPQAVIDRVTTYLASQGITVTKVFNNNLVLKAQATNAQLSATFGTPIHAYSTATGSYQKPTGKVVIPAVLQDVVTRVTGLSTQAVYRPHTKYMPAEATTLDQTAFQANPAATPTAGNPGSYSVGDLAKRNNITPLYSGGTDGTGTTLGIMTFATFTPSDAPVYWAWAGLTGSQASVSRITTINVGTGQTSDGADETTLDVEQSGGIAPGANIRVYVAPNTDAGAIALYTQAITENLCDTLSISWGEAEIYYNPASDFAPYDALFLQAAAQGTPISAAAGDEAAYDINYSGAYPYPNYTAALSLDFPSSSPYVVSAGGTTLPVTLKLSKGTITVPSERPWGWDYLRDYIVTNSGQAAYYKSDFPVGGGGGVSVIYPLPTYQQGLAGVLTSAAGQGLYCVTSPTVKSGAVTCTPGNTASELPGTTNGMLAAGFAGRNSPDLSLNADPESGQALYYNARWSTGSGGTSFVAPQLNGIFALLSQKIGGRIGWPHPQLYSIFKSMGYGTGSPFRAITSGTNLYYSAGASYNPATGIGTLDVANLAAAWPKTPVAPLVTSPRIAAPRAPVTLVKTAQ